MSHEIAPNHPLRRLFGGLVEQVFITELGLADPDLTDYLSELLVDFIHVDRIHRLRDAGGQAIREVSRMEAEAQLGPDVDEVRRNWLVHKHIGDFTLFWIGVYPENLRRPRMGADLVREYMLQGKRSYSIVSGLTRADTRPSAAVFRSLGEQFEFCVHGLHRVRVGWERLGLDPLGN